MFHPTAGTDDVFLIAIAMIAGMVILMVAATFIVLRSANKNEYSARPKDEINSIPPVEIVASSPSTERPEIDLPSTLPADAVTASPWEARPKIEFHLSPGAIRVIRSLWGIFLTTALMFAFTGIMARVITFNNNLGGLIMLIGLPFGTALAGTLGVRVTHLEWRLMIAPVLLFVGGAILLMATQLYISSPFFLIPAVIGAAFVPSMNREGKQVGISNQSLNWIACFIIASVLAFWGYLRLRQILGPPLPIPVYFYWFAIILTFVSPACIAVAWLRLTGSKWLPALLMIPSMPVGVFIILVLTAERG